MAIGLILVLSYLLLSLLVGLLARRRARSASAPSSTDTEGRRDYVLGPGLSGLTLFATMAATNFSAFTVFGLSGAGYRLGWAYYPLMGFGTGLMAVSFILIGIPLRRRAAERGYLSPADFIADRFGSAFLGRSFSLALIALTLPYFASQAVAGGRLLELAAGIPYWLGSALVVGVTALYTLGGGFRAVAATDSLQLIVLLGGAGISFAAILGRAGGLVGLGEKLAESAPALLARGGAGGGLPFASLLGTWLLWCLADPLFPQLTQRFYAAKDDRSLVRTAALYPLVTGGLFFLTIGVGLAGAALLPGLSGSATEQVFTRLAMAEGKGLLAAIFLLAALAALMSTMDSQLLTVSSMIVRDFLPRRAGGGRVSAAPERLILAGMALAAWLVAQRPPALILEWLGKLAFPGYAALAPVLIAGLYARTGALAASGGLATGLALVILEATGILKLGPVPASAFNLGVQILVMAGIELLRPGRGALAPQPPLARLGDLARPGWLLALLLLILSQADLWNYGRTSVLVWGLPTWLLSSAGGCVALSLLFFLWKAPKKA